MNRITPEQVVAAYQATGLTPLQSSYAGRDAEGHVCAACGLTAMAAAEGVAIDELIMHFLPGIHIRRELYKKFGYTEEYLVGFADGFDQSPVLRVFDDGEPYHDGYEDGKAAWAAVKRLVVI